MGLLLALTLALSPATIAASPGVELEKLIDTTVQLPGTTGPILFDSVAPVACGEGAVFYAIEDDIEARRGAYYVSSTTLQVIADPDTPVPDSDSAGTFLSVEDVRCVGEKLFFRGSEMAAPNRRWSIYRWAPGGYLNLVQKKDVDVGGRIVESFLELSANRLGIAMRGRFAFPEPAPAQAMVVKPHEMALTLVADSSTVLPGQSQPVTIYSLPVLDGFDLWFRARTDLNIGLYRWSASHGISIVADSDTPVPASAGTFLDFGLMVLLSEGLAFDATHAGGQGVFIVRNGQIEPLVVLGDQTEDGETITAAYEASGGGGLLGFTGTTLEHPLPAVYARTVDGSIRRLLGTGDYVDGSQVVLIKARADASSVVFDVYTEEDPIRMILFRVQFGSSGVSIPAMSTAGLAALAVLLALAGYWMMAFRGLAGAGN